MNRQSDLAIVLSRIDYGERDRILTLLCANQGKVSVLAKGVRSPKSKLAGGIELFSESQVDFVQGKGGLCVLTSSRLKRHFPGLIKNLDKTMLGYELLKIINKITEDSSGQEYYSTLLYALSALDKIGYSKEFVKLWFGLQILKIDGHSPNLVKDTNGKKLELVDRYSFDLDKQCFAPRESGRFAPGHIKLLRLCLASKKPKEIKVEDNIVSESLELINRLLSEYIR